jgi:hypothetical protein
MTPERDWNSERDPTIKAMSRHHAAAHVCQVANAETLATSLDRARLAAKKRPSNRPPASFSNRACRFSALLPTCSMERTSHEGRFRRENLRLGVFPAKLRSEAPTFFEPR